MDAWGSRGSGGEREREGYYNSKRNVVSEQTAKWRSSNISTSNQFDKKKKKIVRTASKWSRHTHTHSFSLWRIKTNCNKVLTPSISRYKQQSIPPPACHVTQYVLRWIETFALTFSECIFDALLLHRPSTDSLSRHQFEIDNLTPCMNHETMRSGPRLTQLAHSVNASSNVFKSLANTSSWCD